MLYKDYVQSLRDKFIGAVVYYDGERHTVVDVDYNGALLIDRPASINSALSWQRPGLLAWSRENHNLNRGRIS